MQTTSILGGGSARARKSVPSLPIQTSKNSYRPASVSAERNARYALLKWLKPVVTLPLPPLTRDEYLSGYIPRFVSVSISAFCNSLSIVGQYPDGKLAALYVFLECPCSHRQRVAAHELAEWLAAREQMPVKVGRRTMF
ncbi:hypothetical protein SAMN02745857_00440 [Andreprevotia lacus DSM 23236]|uniref:Uncharacterized protein n=1 Tax=Andreprevotia lacus DSM 23236 TaxID=1121001 RepID=A0A1W1X247_9NEIS|nr:hypothetical protein SAMN02745857_00440 [Andreprevotia lacus DSM 23236]